MSYHEYKYSQKSFVIFEGRNFLQKIGCGASLPSFQVSGKAFESMTNATSAYRHRWS